MKCEPQTSVAQPRYARVSTRIFEFGIEVGQHRCSRGLMLKPVEVDLDEVAAQLHPSLDPVDALPMDQFRRLVPIGWPEVMTKVVHHMKREETERQRGLDRVEMKRREMVHPQESILGEEVLKTPPFGVGWHGSVRSHGAGGCDQREVGAMTPFLQQHPQRTVEVRHRRVHGGHAAPDGRVIRLQGERVKLHLALRRRLHRRQDLDSLVGMEVLDQLSAVPRFLRDQEEVSTKNGTRQSGQMARNLGHRRAGGGSQGHERLLGSVVLGREGAHRFAVAVLLGDQGLLHRLASRGLHVVGIDVDGVPGRDVPECDQTGAQGGLELQGACDRNRLQEPVLGGRRGEKRQASEKAQVGTADRIDGTNASSRANDRLKDATSSQTLMRESFGFGRSSRRHEVRDAQLEEGGNEAEATRACGREATFAQRRDVMLEGMLGDEASTRLPGAVEGCDFLVGEQASGEGLRGQPFFLESP